MSTALALVNRVRAKRREGTSSILTDKDGIAYLDLVNSAITKVLEERTWDFQRRSNGLVYLIPTFSGTLFAPSPGSTTLSFLPYTGTNSTLTGSFVTRVIGIGDPDYGNTSFRIDVATLVGSTVIASFEDVWPGIGTGLSWRTIVYEYLLPSYVREVTEVRLQEQAYPLVFTNDPDEYARAFPRPQDDLGPPECVAVGGEVKNTGLIGGATADYGLALRVWPVPDLEYVLNYSYIRRQTVLVSATDTLDRTPPAVEDMIVDLASARAMIVLEKDMTNGLPIEAQCLRDLDRLHRNHLPAAGKRPSMRALDQIQRSRTNPLSWLPRQVDGLSGS